MGRGLSFILKLLFVTLIYMEVRVKGNSGKAGSMEDADGNGDLDLVVQIVDGALLLSETA